jgi:pyridoxine kinase
MNLLSIQSHVAYGHVGNSAAVFALQRLGCEVWPIHTVQFSNHTGYGAWKGHAFDASEIGAVVDGIADRGALSACDGVLSGYMGSDASGEAILAAVGKVKATNAKASYCCDPVIGNRGRGVFVKPGIADFIRTRAVLAADIVTPNHFELDRIAERETRSLGDILSAIEGVHARGPRTVLVTSVRSSDTPDDALDVIGSDPIGRYRVRTPRLAVAANGAGDLIAALFFFHYLRGGDLAAALGTATSSVYGVLQATLAASASEIALIAAQEELVTPSERFTPTAL